MQTTQTYGHRELRLKQMKRLATTNRILVQHGGMRMRWNKFFFGLFGIILSGLFEDHKLPVMETVLLACV